MFTYNTKIKLMGNTLSIVNYEKPVKFGYVDYSKISDVKKNIKFINKIDDVDISSPLDNVNYKFVEKYSEVYDSNERLVEKFDINRREYVRL
jgi:hypothetical protein